MYNSLTIIKVHYYYLKMCVWITFKNFFSSVIIKKKVVITGLLLVGTL